MRGTRVGQGPDYGENTADKSVANSSYNALETTLRYQHGGSRFMLSYAYAKSIDQGSNIGEQRNPTNPKQSRINFGLGPEACVCCQLHARAARRKGL